MANGFQNPLVVYGTLVGAGIAAFVSVYNHQLTGELASNPRARPEAFTASDGRELAADCRNRIDNLSKQTAREFDQLRREIEKLESQVLYLYQQNATGNE